MSQSKYLAFGGMVRQANSRRAAGFSSGRLAFLITTISFYLFKAKTIILQPASIRSRYLRELLVGQNQSSSLKSDSPSQKAKQVHFLANSAFSMSCNRV